MDCGWEQKQPFPTTRSFRRWQRQERGALQHLAPRVMSIYRFRDVRPNDRIRQAISMRITNPRVVSHGILPCSILLLVLSWMRT